MRILLSYRIMFLLVRHCNHLKKNTVHTELSLIKYYAYFITFVLTFFSPWLVSQEATLLFPVSSGIDGGFSSSVPLADIFSPSLLSWLPEAGRREMCEKTKQKSWTHWTKLMQENTEDIFPRPVFEKDKVSIKFGTHTKRFQIRDVFFSWSINLQIIE